MSDAWDDWEAAEEAGAFDNVKVKGSTSLPKATTDLRHELDVRQFQKSSGDSTPLDLKASKVAPEFETQQTAAFQVRILKRPDAQKPRETASPVGSGSGTSTPPGAAGAKSLQQREAEYLKARERIFGTTTPTTTNTPNTAEGSTPAILKPSSSPSPAVAKPAASPSPRAGPVTREPKGPDGSKGFASRTGSGPAR